MMEVIVSAQSWKANVLCDCENVMHFDCFILERELHCCSKVISATIGSPISIPSAVLRYNRFPS